MAKFIEKTLSFFEFNLILILFSSVLFVLFSIQSKIDYNELIKTQNVNFEKQINEFIKEKELNITIEDQLLKEKKDLFMKKHKKTKELSESNIDLIVNNSIKIYKLNEIYKEKTKEEKLEFNNKIKNKILHTKEESFKLFILNLD